MNKQIFFIPFLWSLVYILILIVSRVSYYTLTSNFIVFTYILLSILFLVFMSLDLQFKKEYISIEAKQVRMEAKKIRMEVDKLRDKLLAKKEAIDLDAKFYEEDILRIKRFIQSVNEIEDKLEEQKQSQYPSPKFSLDFSDYLNLSNLSSFLKITFLKKIKYYVKNRSLIEKYLAFNLTRLLKLSFLVSLSGMIFSLIFPDVSPLCLDILSAVPVLYALRYWILLWRVENELFGRNYYEVKELIQFIESRYKKNDDDFGSNGGERVFPYVGASKLSVPEDLTQAGEGA